MIQFTDTAQIRISSRKTADGYKLAYARVARTGVQNYKGYEVGRPDLDEVRIWRPPEEVFKRDAMHSLAHKPVTLTHPNEMVDADNWRKYAIGHVGDEVTRDGDTVRVPMMLCDAEAIAAVERGVRELSVGYTTDLKWRKGKTPAGELYDAVQTDIRANHLALVPAARGGSNLSIGDATRDCPDCGSPMMKDAKACATCGAYNQDAWMPADEMYEDGDLFDREFSAEARKKLAKTGAAMPHGGFPISNTGDLKNAIRAIGRAKNPGAAKAHIIKRAKALGATSLLPDDWTKSSSKDHDVNHNRRTTSMLTTVTFDGVPVELEDKDAAIINAHVDKLRKEIVDQKKKAGAAAEEEEEAEEELRQQKDALEKKNGEITALKKQIEDAQVTPEKLDALVKERLGVVERAGKLLDARFSYDGKSNADIRRAAVVAKLGDAVGKAMSDAAIEGAFLALAPNASSGVRDLGRALSDAGRPNYRPGGMTLSDAEALKEQALDERDRRMADAWRTKPPAVTNN